MPGPSFNSIAVTFTIDIGGLKLGVRIVTMLHSALAVQCGDRGVNGQVLVGLSLVTLLGDSSATSSAVVRLLD
jgi:hypothetical protein